MIAMCKRCGNNPALFFYRLPDQSYEGLCFKCAKKAGLPQALEMIKQVGLSDEDIDQITEHMQKMMENADVSPEEMEAISRRMMEFFGESDENFEPGGAPSFPAFLQPFVSEDPPASLLEESGEPRQPEFPIIHIARVDGRGEPSGRKDEKKGKKRKFLDNCCEDLTAKAEQGRLDRIIGRDREIYRVMQILNRRQKNNPCLIGEPGVGKTAIAEGIAQRLAWGAVPPRLADKRLYLLDLTALVAGTQFRGQFESRVKGLLSDIREEGNVILFIDEVHNLIGAGDAEGSMNAANILKPALSRGEIQVIGATTFDEYRRNIEKDAALERRFQPVTVNEPSIEEAVQVLTGIKGYYELFHSVRVSDEVVRRCVTMSERYITDRYLPDKAIDLLDEACSCCTLDNAALFEYEQLKRRKAEQETLLSELESRADEEVYRAIAETRSDIARLEQKLSELEGEALGREVTVEDLARVVELWTGIPATKIRESELQKVSGLEEALKARVIGQDEAVSLVAAAVRRTRVQLSARRRPASFIFVGPTGVGKTELVRVLSKELFDDADPLIRLDMSEFMEKHSVSRIVGSPPGYVGYDEAGQLTEKVRRRPYSVVLFDEIEKAHPDVLNILLQILDEGRITDAHGRMVSFENTVIVMTSNAGSNLKGGAYGFDKSEDQLSRERATRALADFLRPEFLARVDEIVVFRPLSPGDYERIAALMLDELKTPLSERGIRFGYDDAALSLLAQRAFGKKAGARDLRQEIRRSVEDPLTLLLVDAGEHPPEMIALTVQDGELRLVTD